jgi:predicted Zn-dependent protease with MMP-like domain
MDIPDEEFERLVAEGIDELPDKVRHLMNNVAVTIADDMTDDERISYGISKEDELFGFYYGIPQTERGSDYAALPDKITIFKKPILAAYTDPEDIRACISNTVWHEVAHHFGYGEDWIAAEEEKRGKTL